MCPYEYIFEYFDMSLNYHDSIINYIIVILLIINYVITIYFNLVTD